MNILIWHVHGSWTTNFVQGPHTYIVPVVAGRGPEGRGRAQTWDWPSSVIERTPAELADTRIDVLIAQRPHDLLLARHWLGRIPGRGLPTIWLEHNMPQGRINAMCHPARNREDLTIVHVTQTNALFWDTGSTATRVIEHGVIDPGRRWTGVLDAAGIVVNEPVRRARVTGTDLLARFGEVVTIDVFGLGTDELPDHLGRPDWLRTYDGLTQHEMHDHLARRRCYIHPFRWTSLGLSLVEAMMLGMPVVALATTEVPDALPPGVGIISNDVNALVESTRRLSIDFDAAAELGAAARAHATERFSLERFLTDWNELLEETCP